MRIFAAILSFCLLCTVAQAGSPGGGKIFPTLKPAKAASVAGVGNITYVRASSSINGPFSSPKTLNSGDSLFIQTDVTPMGSVELSFIIDVNQNAAIDSFDVQIGGALLVDNGGTGKDTDLDPNPGVIVINIETGESPSMEVIALGTEGGSSAVGLVSFENSPQDFTLSGYVFTSVGDPVAGVAVMVSDSSMMVTGDMTDVSGYFTIPVDAGNYSLMVQDWTGRFTSFDTTMIITGNTVQNFTLKTLTSFIRGYVRDNLSNPIAGVQIYADRNSGSITDAQGMYQVMVAPGSGYVGLEGASLLPNYMQPNSHYYTIADDDSIVNNSISNFVCYATNSSITGTVTENGAAATRQYMINAWCETIQSSSMALTDGGGDYTLPIYVSGGEQYGVNLSDWNGDYPFPDGMYPDTSYWGLTGGSVADFNLIGALTTYTDPFTGWGQPSAMWNFYQHGNPWGVNSTTTLDNDRLKVECNSNSGLSGLGVLSTKPFTLSNKEFRIFADPTGMMNSNNKIWIILSNSQRNWDPPENFENSLQLVWEKNGSGQRQWRLMKSENGTFTNLCTSPDSTGQHILFQFIDPDTLKLVIRGSVCYYGAWSKNFSMAYVYLAQSNLDPEESNPVYFDEFFWGGLGTTGVKETGGTVPKTFSLEQNFPNPFNPVTSIKYHIPAGSYVTLKLFNLLGQEVSSLVDESQPAGNYEVSFDASGQPSGVYYYRLTAVDETSGGIIGSKIMKALLLK